jgi:hypothetical protein
MRADNIGHLFFSSATDFADNADGNSESITDPGEKE